MIISSENYADGNQPQFSRYITTPSTTTATSSELEPPSAPPPPPPPLNLPPSRARRQLAARLALHSKQNAELSLEHSKGDGAEQRKDVNPFATDEDDDSDEEDKDFTIGDLEVEEEGKGHLPAGTGLVGNEQALLGRDPVLEKNVGIQHLASSRPLSSGPEIGSQWNSSGAGSSFDDRSARATFPLLWPFGAKAETGGNDRNHFRGADRENADNDEMQSSDSDSDEDNHDFGDVGQPRGVSGKRRLSVTTEAKRRTSIEDDDEDEEVVHVAMAEAHIEPEGRNEVGGDADDGEIVEIQHAEMQGVEEK